MGEVLSFKPSDRRTQRRRTTRTLAHLNGYLVELIDLSVSGVAGGSVELLSYSEIGLEVGDQAELRLPRPVLDEDDPDFGHPATFSAPIPVEVVRSSHGTRSFGARFAALSGPQIALIQDLMLRGSI